MSHLKQSKTLTIDPGVLISYKGLCDSALKENNNLDLEKYDSLLHDFH